MYGHYSKGLLAVFLQAPPAPGDDYPREWFATMLQRAIPSGLASRGFLFRRAPGTIATGGPDPGFLALFESDQPDLEPLAAMASDLADEPAGVSPGGPGGGAYAQLTWTFRQIGPEFRVSRPESSSTTGIQVVLTDRLPQVPEGAFDEWYNEIHIPEILQKGLFHTVYRYRAADAAPGRAEYAALYETDGDPALSANRILEFRGRWSTHPRYGSVSEIKLRSAFIPIAT